MNDPWELRLDDLGTYIREQRKLAQLSLRELAEIAQVSNPYLSQLERGLHEPSVRVLRSIAKALNLSAESMLEHAGFLARPSRSEQLEALQLAEINLGGSTFKGKKKKGKSMGKEKMTKGKKNFFVINKRTFMDFCYHY